MNVLTYVYLEFARHVNVRVDKEFRVLVFRSPKNLTDSAADEFYGYTNTISKEVSIMLNVQKNDLLRQIKRSQTILDANKKA